MTTPKLANAYSNTELLDLDVLGHDHEDDDTNIGFNIPKRFTDFNFGFTNEEEFLNLHDSLVERFPEFKKPVFNYLKNNDPIPLKSAVNQLLDPADQNAGIHEDVSNDLITNLDYYKKLPEDQQLNLINVLEDREGIEGNSFWRTTNQTTNQTKEEPIVDDETIKFLGVQTYFHKGEASRKPQTRIRQEKLFTELTGYTVDQLINNEIPIDVLKSIDFQKGINSFYESNSDKIKLADKENLSINEIIALEGTGLTYEIATNYGVNVATLPLLKKGPKGIAAYALINFSSSYINNKVAQRLRGEENISEGEGFAAGIFGMIPYPTLGKGLKGYFAAGTQGAVIAGGEAQVRTAIDEQRFLTPDEAIAYTSFGTLFGTGLKGLGDSFGAIVKKYQGKSPAEIDKLLTKKENNVINKIIEKTAKPVYALGPEFDKLSDKAKKVLKAVESGNEKSISKKDLIEVFTEINEKYPDKLPLEIKQALENRSKKLLKKPPSSGSAKEDTIGPLNQTPHQFNPKQTSDYPFTKARIENLQQEGGTSFVKSQQDTMIEAVELRNRPDFQDIVERISKERNVQPSDSFQFALALEITDLNNRIGDVNQRLINAINVTNNPKDIETLGFQLIETVGELDTFLGRAIPLRSDQARGVSAMGIPTEGVASMSPQAWANLTDIQKREFLKNQSSGIAISDIVSSKRLTDFSESINNAINRGNETGNYADLNKLVNALKRSGGDFNKVEKLYKYGILTHIANGDLIDNKVIKSLNEIWLSSILYGPDTHVINAMSSTVETIAANIELYLDPKNLTNPRELEVAVKHTINLFTGFDFALKGAKESFKLESNYFN